MMKMVFTLSTILLINTLFAQDFIYKSDGSEIEVKVIEITTDVIKYKKYDFLDGPIYNIKIENVFMIVYENGQKEVFKNKVVHQEDPSNNNIVPITTAVEIADIPPAPANKPPAPKNLGEFQSSVQFGITAGFNIASAYYNYEDNNAQPVGGILFAPAGGLTVSLNITKKFAIQSGVYYMGKGDNINLEKTYEDYLAIKYPGKDTKIDGYFKNVLGYIQIPVTFNFVIPLNKSTVLHIGPGAYFALGIFGKQKADYTISVAEHGQWYKVEDVKSTVNVKFYNTIPSSTEENTVYTKRTDMGAVLNIGIKDRKFMLSSITSIGLINTRPNKTDSNYDPSKEKTKTICGSIVLTYFFN